MNTGRIFDKAKQLGLDIDSSVSTEERLQQIADQLGVDIADVEKALDAELETGLEDESLYDSPEGLAEVEYLDDTTGGQTGQEGERQPGFGEEEFRRTEGDKDYYKNKGKKLDDELKENKKKAEEAKKEAEEKRKEAKEKKKESSGEERKADNQAYRNANKESKKADKAVKSTKRDIRNNKISNIKNKMYQVTHPLDAAKSSIKNSAKNAAKNTAKKAGKAVGKGAAKAGKTVGKAAVAAGKAIASGIAKLISLIISNPYVLLAVVIILIVIFLIVLLFMVFGDVNGGSYMGLYGYEYIEPKCTEITISGGEYAGVYDLEEYIAGVVAGEFYTGELWNESAKAGAIAARSFVQANVDDSCTVISSSTFQNYKTPSEIHIQIAQETRGLVLVDYSSGKIKSTQYDAFCTASPQDDPDNYIVCQKNQKIPRSWVDSQTGIIDEWKNGTKYEAHGNGMSAWGAMYLAEQGSDYEDILEYYYGDFEIKSIYKSFGYTGEFPIEPNNELYANLSFLTGESFSNFLVNHGSSVEEYDSYLYDSIEDAGIGTREGVVTAAVTLIGSLAEMGIKINYQWGGKYYQIGTNPNWGTTADMSWLCNNYANSGYDKSVCTTNYKWHGFDCSGFVNWALRNGMQDNTVTQQYTSTSSGTSLKANEAVCKPGGTLVSEGHIVLVVGDDAENKRYIVAESTGSRIATGVGGVKLSYYNYNANGYVCKNLDDLYGE